MSGEQDRIGAVAQNICGASTFTVAGEGFRYSFIPAEAFWRVSTRRNMRNLRGLGSVTCTDDCGGGSIQTRTVSSRGPRLRSAETVDFANNQGDTAAATEGCVAIACHRGKLLPRVYLYANWMPAQPALTIGKSGDIIARYVAVILKRPGSASVYRLSIIGTLVWAF